MSWSTSFRSSPSPTMMPGLGEHRRVELLHLLQEPERGEVARAGPHRQVVRRHGLEVVVEDVGLRRDHGLDRAVLAQEVRASAPRSSPGSPAGSPRWSPAKCPAPPSSRSSRSTEVTTTWARPSLAVASATFSGSAGSSGARQPGPHVAEGAGARAGVAHDHEGGVLLRPALADIRAAGLLADRDEAVLADDARRLAEDRRARAPSPGSSRACAATGASGRCAFSG